MVNYYPNERLERSLSEAAGGYLTLRIGRVRKRQRLKPYAEWASVPRMRNSCWINRISSVFFVSFFMKKRNAKES